jgi:hypothetical protein
MKEVQESSADLQVSLQSEEVFSDPVAVDAIPEVDEEDASSPDECSAEDPEEEKAENPEDEEASLFEDDSLSDDDCDADSSGRRRELKARRKRFQQEAATRMLWCKDVSQNTLSDLA